MAPKPELLSVADAAVAAGIHEQTVWRYLRQRLLKRYKSVPGAPRKTMVDMRELRQLREMPPAEAVVTEPAPQSSRPAAPEPLKPLAAAVIVRDGRVLLTERRYHEHGEVWSWPSGKVEKNETLEEAILRELHEELLLAEATVLDPLGVHDLPSGYRMTVFHVAIPPDATPRLNDYEQLVQLAWMTREEAAVAFRTLPAEIAKAALEVLDRALAAAAVRAAE